MAKEPKKLDELFHETLKDIFFAEKKILATLPKMAKAAQTDELRAAFEKHESEAEDRSSRGRVLPIVVASQVRGRALRPDALHRADVRSGASMALIRDGQQCVALGGIGRAKLMPQSLIERRRQ